MRKTKKQLLGLAGLAAVGIMTAVAYAMPTPDAAAAEQNTYACNDSDSDPNNDCAKSDTGAQIQVTITEVTPSVYNSFPRDGSELSNPKFRITGSYSDATKINFYLTYTSNNGITDSDVVKRIDLESFTPTVFSAGTYAIETDITPYGQGNYTLHVQAQGYNGAHTPEDTITFTYRSVAATVDPEISSNGDPSIDVSMDDDVDKVFVQVYDKNGDPVFKDKDGNPKPIEVDRKDIDPVTGKVKVPLPFEENDAKAGDYTVVIVAQDKDGNILSMVTSDLGYKPIVPEVPNTSAGFLADLNITRIDYLLTGLIIFSLVAGFGLYLVCRKSRR